MSTILVTGAAGFIGSHTAEQLLTAGHCVIALDNFRTGLPANLTIARANSGFVFEETDVSLEGRLDEAVAKHHPDAIIHLAALIGVQESVGNPSLNYQLNVQATHFAAEAARRHSVPRVVFASSAAVYGDAGDQPIEEWHPKAPLSPYGAAKLASEALLLGHATAYRFTVVCLRYFNVFGPRQLPSSPYAGVISLFSERLRAGERPTIYGDGLQTRDFISVHDVAQANVLAAIRPVLGSCALNVCTGRSTSLNDLGGIFGHLHRRLFAPVFEASRPGEIRHSRGAPGLASRDLGFTARVTLEAGLSELAEAAR